MATRIYALQSFTATDGTVVTAKQTYTLTDSAAYIAFQRGQAQPLDGPETHYPFYDGYNHDVALISRDADGNITWPDGNKQTAVIFGDSITAQNRSDTSTFLKYSDRGYFTWGNAYLGQRLELLKNAGVNGNTTSMMLARINNDVLDYNAGWNFVLGGLNDILTGVPWLETVGNLKKIYDAIRLNNGNVVAMAILPCGQITTTTQKEALVNINLYIKNYAVRNQKVWFVDTFTPLLNPASATGAPVTTYMWDSTTHPSTLGAQLMGKAIFNVLDTVIPEVAIQTSIADICSATNLYGNLVENPVMEGTTGTNQTGSSGTLARDWLSLIASGTATVVCSKEARTDYPNLEWSKYVITSTSGTSSHYFYATSATVFTSGLVVGDEVYANFEWDVSFSGVTVTQLKPYIVADNATGLVTAYANGNNDGSIRNDGPYIFRTPNFTIPADTTKIRLIFEIDFTGTGEITGKAGRVELRKVN